MPAREFSDSEVEAAIAALSRPGRLRFAQELVSRSAPRLQGVLNEALDDGGWFGPAHEQAVREAVETEPPEDRGRAVSTLVAEETRLGMLVGVAVGFELARELDDPRQED